jgi:hypothetical protein
MNFIGNRRINQYCYDEPNHYSLHYYIDIILNKNVYGKLDYIKHLAYDTTRNIIEPIAFNHIDLFINNRNSVESVKR